MFRVIEGQNGSCILDKSTGRVLCVIPQRSEATITSSSPPTSNCKKNKQPALHVVPETRSRNNSSSSVNRTNDDNCDKNKNVCRVNQPSSSQSSNSQSSSTSVSSNPNSGSSILTKCGLLTNGLNGSSNSTLASLLLSPNNVAKTDSGAHNSKISINQSERSHRSQQKQKVENLLKVDLCSALGQKMLATAPEAKFKFNMTNFYFKTEKNCSTENKSVHNGVISDVNRPRPGKSRMTRSNNVINGLVAPSWAPRHYVHTYTFNKTQRLERWRTLETGLNWRGRIKAFCCRTFKVTSPRLISCPLCKTHIGRTKNHNCSDHRSVKRISPSTNKCIEDQTNMDPKVIFADLKDNTEFILSLTERRRSRYPTRLNGSRLNANKTKVTSNGDCKNDVAIINTKGTDDKKRISNSLNNVYHNVHNNVENTDHKNHHVSTIYETPSDCPSTSNSPICDPSSPTNTLKADDKHVFHFDEPKCYSFYFTNYL